MSLSIILTCYNEKPLIFDSYEKIVSMMDLTNIEYELIVVDDGSCSKIQKELTEYFKKKSNTRLILSDINEGRGAAVTKGIKASSKVYAGFIDTDLEIPEYSLLNLYYAIKGTDSDMVIGKRIYLLSWNINHWFRFIYSRVYFLFANIFLNLHFLDTETGIKLFKREKILPLLDSIGEKRWFWDTEIVALSLKSNLKVSQVPVFVLKNKEKSSVTFLRDTKRYLEALYKYHKKQRL